MKRLTLNKLQVRSFVIELNESAKKTVIGGDTFDYTIDGESSTSVVVANCQNAITQQANCHPK